MEDNEPFRLILANVAQHISLTPAEADCFTSLLRLKTIRKKTFLLTKGEVNHYQSFVTQGALCTYQVDDKDKEHILTFSLENWWAGDLHSFLTKTPTPYFIEALEDTVVLQISAPKLERLYEQVPQFNKFFRIMLQGAFIAQQERIMQNLAASAEERYVALIRKYPHFAQRIPQKKLAVYLGMTPQFLSMLRRKWAQPNASSSS
ncbi:Crp/Fnr family transcriptional regulator [Hymenobacter terrenus]|uniref:Crp/Fnr family transcriptional regulator n=1 Tax=Hymenobacter terrenus TaxID=1629124 RepID=UPI0006194C04|nr:cyclic nucleotide-binding domain-containing protein [Hymenobacter terrenus]